MRDHALIGAPERRLRGLPSSRIHSCADVEPAFLALRVYDRLNEVGLPVGVSATIRVAGVDVGEPLFERCVLRRKLGVAAKAVAKQEVVVHDGGLGDHMQVMGPVAVLVVASERLTIDECAWSMRVPKPRYTAQYVIDGNAVPKPGHDVDDRLGGQPRDRCAPDVFNPAEQAGGA